MSNSFFDNDRMVRIGEVIIITGISKTGIYQRMNIKSQYYDPRFPKSRKLGLRAVGWPHREILKYIGALPDS